MENNEDVMFKLNKILDKQSNLGEKIDNLTIKVEGLDEKLIKLDERISINEQCVKRNEQSTIKNSAGISELDKKFDDIEKSCVHISEQYDDIKQTSDKNTKSITEFDVRLKSLTDENARLNAQINDCKNDLLQEKLARNSDAQYQRTSINVKLCGLPLQPGEIIQSSTPSNPVTSALVTRVCEAANISLLSANDVDVCHRLGSQPRCPVIIRFISKSACYNFFNQRWKLKDIDTTKLDYSELPVVTPRGQNTAAGPGRGGHQTGSKYPLRTRNSVESDETPAYGEPENPHSIYVQEHLTKQTKDLLRDAKAAFTPLHFEYPGYIKDGEVRAKREGTDKPILIRSKVDIENIIKDNE